MKYMLECMKSVNNTPNTDNRDTRTVKLKYNCNNKIVNFNGDYIVKKKSDEIIDYPGRLSDPDPDKDEKTPEDPKNEDFVE